MPSERSASHFCTKSCPRRLCQNIPSHGCVNFACSPVSSDRMLCTYPYNPSIQPWVGGLVGGITNLESRNSGSQNHETPPLHKATLKSNVRCACIAPAAAADVDALAAAGGCPFAATPTPTLSRSRSWRDSSEQALPAAGAFWGLSLSGVRIRGLLRICAWRRWLSWLSLSGLECV